jgi:hypothetical protein
MSNHDNELLVPGEPDAGCAFVRMVAKTVKKMTSIGTAVLSCMAIVSLVTGKIYGKRRKRSCPHFSLLWFPANVGYILLRHPSFIIDMKMFSGFARSVVGQSERRVLCFMLGLAVAILAAGCGKKSTAPVSNNAPPPPTNETATAPVSPPPAPISQPTATVPAAKPAPPSVQALNHVLMGWIIQHHRHPKSFEDFAASANVQIPPPPAGKKYTLNSRGFIILVDN